MMTEIPFHDYIRPVRASARTAAALAARLETAAPADLNAEQRKALRQVSLAAVDVLEVQSERDHLAPAKTRPILSKFTNDWSALYETLSGTSRLGDDDRGARAVRVLASLFPDGVLFTQLPADQAWSEGKRRVMRLEAGDLGAEVEALVGQPFIAAVKKSTATLAAAIGIGKQARPVASTTALSQALLKFGRAVAKYCRTLVSAIDEDDDRSVARFLAAVAPIDVHRAAMRSGGGQPSDGGEPTEPVDPEPVEPDEPDEPDADEPDEPEPDEPSTPTVVTPGGPVLPDEPIA
jgi:hypothetical protein